MLDGNQQSDQQAQVQACEAPYPAPQRVCLICGQQQRRWNGENYECTSGDPEHEDRKTWPWVHVGTQSETTNEEE